MSGIITKPVFWVIMVAMWALVFPLIMGAYNGIYLNTVSSGTTTSERFDRVIPKGTNTASQDAWEAKTAVVDFTASAAGTAVTAVVTSAYILGGDSGKCHVGDLAKTGVTPFEAYTPSGNSVNVTADGKVVGCQYEERSPIFGVFNGFVRVLMQMIALAGPLGFMLALAYFGTMLIGTATGHPVLRVVMVVILVLIGAILVNIVLPYIGDVFLAIDGDRFIVLDQELGLIAGLLRNFFGVIFVSGIIGSAWSIIGQIRGSGTSAGSFQGSGM